MKCYICGAEALSAVTFVEFPEGAQDVPICETCTGNDFTLARITIAWDTHFVNLLWEVARETDVTLPPITDREAGMLTIAAVVFLNRHGLQHGVSVSKADGLPEGTPTFCRGFATVSFVRPLIEAQDFIRAVDEALVYLTEYLIRAPDILGDIGLDLLTGSSTLQRAVIRWVDVHPEVMEDTFQER